MKRVLLALAAIAVVWPAAVEAQFGGSPLPVEYLHFVGGSGQNGTYGVQVGPYVGEFMPDASTGRSTASPQFPVYCVDYLHYASNSNGLVNVSAVGGDLSSTRLNDYGAYQRSAYLASLFDAWESHEAELELVTGMDFDRRTVWSGLHSVIWDGATGPSGLGAGDARTLAASLYFADLADTNAGSFDTSGWFVLSEADVALTASNSGQEFLMRTAEVPEPGTMLLMLTGIGLLAIVSRKRLGEIS